MSSFAITKTKDKRRIGTLATRHGTLQTPFFMPDATRGSVRGLTTEQLTQAGVEAMVVNTYHLLLQPGSTLIKNAGGVHDFMHWNGPLLSDSGGYQVFSLIHKNAEMGSISEEGASFRSVLDGSKFLLTPEKAIQVQFDLGVDMMVCLDDPRPNTAAKKEIESATGRTIRWAVRCKEEYQKQVAQRKISEEDRPLLFGVLQGGTHKDLRAECMDGLGKIGFDGYAFGARYIDEEGKFLSEIMEYSADLIPQEYPRFALGVGTPNDIVKSYAYGWDFFDCVIPTREGRHGRLFRWKGAVTQKNFYDTINIANSSYRKDTSPIDPACSCYACTMHTRSYVHHLFRVREPLGAQLASIHNVHFFTTLTRRLKEAFF